MVDSNGDGIADLADVYPHSEINFRLRISRLDIQGYASPTSYTILIPVINPGEIHRAVYLLGDYGFNASTYQDAEGRLDPDDRYIHGATSFDPTPFPTIGRQETLPNPPSFFHFRGHSIGVGWWTSVDEYPPGTSCDPDALPDAVMTP